MNNLSVNHAIRKGTVKYPHILIDDVYPELIAVIIDSVKEDNGVPIVVKTQDGEHVELPHKVSTNPFTLRSLLNVYTFSIELGEGNSVSIRTPDDIIEKGQALWT